MAAAPHCSLQMKSTDLIRKEPLDYGGFGEVFLCYHVTLGQVVLKTMYTGPLRNEKQHCSTNRAKITHKWNLCDRDCHSRIGFINHKQHCNNNRNNNSKESKRSLLEEGKIMASLDHERVVKLLGVIMEEKDCSLVMELIPRGNLLVMLEMVKVPVSIKGRIILEILEGMMYLTEKNVIHKDIKPENILLDKDFHIKIADLGLATCQTWSRLTREECRRKSRMGHSSVMRGAGTLSYMAPEHLQSIHNPSTEKSDVYSFAIVVWVILTGKEPYPNARSEDQISQCVRNGDRPEENLIPKNMPSEIIQLMKRCWDRNPQERPTFKEAHDFFHPFYVEKLEPFIEEDLLHLKKSYKGPDNLVEKMESLSVNPECFSGDCPAPLRSSDRNVSVPVEASIEDLHNAQYEQCEILQTDAKAVSSPPELQEKLDRELEYHKHGSYNCENQSDAANYFHTASSSLRSNFSTSDHSIRQPEQEKSSVLSWTKAELLQPTPAGVYETSPSPPPSHLHTSSSTPFLPMYNQQHPHSHLDRQQSWPTYPVSDTSAPDITSGHLLTTSKSCPMHDQGSLYIQNASGIQIGSNNTMSIRGYEPSLSLSSISANSSTSSPIEEGIQKYEDHAVTEEHLDLVRDNIGLKWKRCARHLGLTTVEIETIQHDYSRDGLPEMVHQMLECWKMKEGCIGCTIGKLCRALKGSIKVDVIQKILNICSSSSSLG